MPSYSRSRGRRGRHDQTIQNPTDECTYGKHLPGVQSWMSNDTAQQDTQDFNCIMPNCTLLIEIIGVMKITILLHTNCNLGSNFNHEVVPGPPRFGRRCPLWMGLRRYGVGAVLLFIGLKLIVSHWFEAPLLHLNPKP